MKLEFSHEEIGEALQLYIEKHYPKAVENKKKMRLTISMNEGFMGIGKETKAIVELY